jgi:hypothetical protein
MIIPIHPTRKYQLANGTQIRLHSIVLDHLHENEDRAKIVKAAPGEIVEIHCPFEVNVEIINSKQHLWPTTCIIQNMGDKVIILLNETASKLTAVNLSNRYVLNFRNHMYEIGFSYTFHKAPGLTIDRVRMDVRKMTGRGAHLTFPGFFDGVSRVKSGANIIFLSPIT